MKKILVTLEKPQTKKSPFLRLEEDIKVKFTYQPFLQVDPIFSYDFIEQKINIEKYRHILLQNINSLRHYFRLLDELKIKPHLDNLYFCGNEIVGQSLRKYINYKKRKVFIGNEHSFNLLFSHILKYHKKKETILYPCSNYQDEEIIHFFESHKIKFQVGVSYTISYLDLKKIIPNTNYDVFCFLTPKSVDSFFENFPDFKKKKSKILSFGHKTKKALEKYNTEIDCALPNETTASLFEGIKLLIPS